MMFLLNLLNSQMSNSIEPQQIKLTNSNLEMVPEIQEGVFFSKRILKDAEFRLRESKRILEEAKKLKDQLNNSKFF